jgi:hypothetical protein
MASTEPVDVRVVSRRGFLQACVLASGGLAPLVPGSSRWVPAALAQPASTPKKGGTLRVGFYIEAATMDPHL